MFVLFLFFIFQFILYPGRNLPSSLPFRSSPLFPHPPCFHPQFLSVSIQETAVSHKYQLYKAYQIPVRLGTSTCIKSGKGNQAMQATWLLVQTL